MIDVLRGLRGEIKEEQFVGAIYGLFDEFRNAYLPEWKRIDGCEHMYRGDHWYDIKDDGKNDPRPTTPILFSTIENVRADMTDEFPEAIIKPEDLGDELLAKILTALVRQNLEACDYDEEYDKLTHDLLVTGWMCQESGWDANGNNGNGCAYLRHVPNKNVMFDPHCDNIQDGRASFKFALLPDEWFRQHYPEKYKEMRADYTSQFQHHDDYTNTTSPLDTNFRVLIEAWFRIFNPKTRSHSVHMVLLAGGKILENSYDVKPEGYYRHGMYPFVVTPLYTQKGSPLGLGIVDMFKNAQQHSDKVDQIILKNAYSAAHNRIVYMDDSVDPDELGDFSKELIKTSMPPNTAFMWVPTKPLPSHMLAYRDSIRAAIKEESGSNDFSRGNVSSGVTAASAITALQEMSSKRSRMEARRIHYGHKQGVRMMLENIREFDLMPRTITTTVNGETISVVVGASMYKMLDGGRIVPIEYSVSIKTARETKFTKLSNNQLILEFAAMFQGQIDPAILMEAMDFEGQNVVLEKLKAATGKGIAALTEQLNQLTAAFQQMQAENGNLRSALTSAQEAMASMQGKYPSQVQ